MDGNSKQLLSERIKSATNILVTVSRDPSVDELSAALGLTLMLNKMDKHATAVFSGAVPPAISFLQPEKTFEGTVDSLRDFIIALDKEKADRLRYKVEDDVVRIFITPYRTTITQNDLQFSQGDFNVELIIALGVEKKDDLDTAISAHGRILHDATVATVNANNQRSDLGSIDWSDSSASSLCEMLMSLSESLQSGILDQQISTALLTGIVAATDRFSNQHTSPKVMTMAAQLMAAGANQQLIATKLEQGHELIKPGQSKNGDGSTAMTEGASQKVAPDDAKGEMHIDHEHEQQESQQKPQPQGSKDEETLANELHRVAPAAPNLSVSDLQKDLANAHEELDQASEPTPKSRGSDWRDKNSTPEPSFGGTLNATTDEAAEDKRREERSSRNHVLLSHDSPASNTLMASPINSSAAENREPESVDPFAEPMHSDLGMPSYEQTPMAPHEEAPEPPKPELTPAPQPQPEPKPEPTPAPEPPKPAEPQEAFNDSPTLGSVSDANATGPHIPNLLDLEDKAHERQIVDENSTLTDARAAVDAALGSAPYQPERLESAGATSFPEIHHDESHDDTAGALPPPPPLPDFSTLPPLPGEEHHDQPPIGTTDPTPPPMPPQPVTPPTANDPAQFRLPGQP